jgi:hypothetical protein
MLVASETTRNMTALGTTVAWAKAGAWKQLAANILTCLLATDDFEP